jgi:hypothetical protein
LIDGAWHLVALKPLPRVRAGLREWDVILGRPVAEIDTATARKHYGAPVYAVAKRRLARRELSQYPIPAEVWT